MLGSLASNKHCCSFFHTTERYVQITSSLLCSVQQYQSAITIIYRVMYSHAASKKTWKPLYVLHRTNDQRTTH